MELDKIITGDSAVVLQSFDSDCIDLTVTSPPYDNLRTYNGFVFDFETIAKELYRVTKPGGVVVWVVGDATINGSETGTSFKQALSFKECGFNLHDTMIYQKLGTATHDPRNKRYKQVIEYMFILSKGSPKTYNEICDVKTKNKNSLSATHRKPNGDMRFYPPIQYKKFQARPCVWVYDVGFMKTTKDKIANSFPALFPEALATDHIKSWSVEGDVVLDPFCGSGTTPKMAKTLSRHYIGIEVSSKYVSLAEKRLLATNVPLFGQGRGLTPREPDGGDSAPSQALSTPDMFSAIEHEPTPAPRR